MTELELEVTLLHVRKQWDNPNRNDWYLMQIASKLHEVIQYMPKKRLVPPVEPKSFKLAFDTGESKKEIGPGGGEYPEGPNPTDEELEHFYGMTKEQAAQLSMATWIGRAGYKGKVPKV